MYPSICHLTSDIWLATYLKWNYAIEDSNTSPLDREQLLRRGSNKRPESEQSKYRMGRLSIVEGPLRRVLKDQGEWYDKQLLRVNERHVEEWVRGIPAVMRRVACHQTHFPEFKMIEVWQKFKRNIEGLSQDVTHSLFPILPYDKATQRLYGLSKG